jgi:HSP20 family protein
MAITRYRTRNWPSPWQELEEMSSRLSRAFNDGGTAESGGPGWVPAVNVEETKDELVLTAELPGMKQEDVEIELENNILTIRGSKEHTREEKDEERRYHLWERRWGSFQRSFTLPRSVSPDRIGASFENGVLTVHMPKVAEARSRRIEIGEGSANTREVTSGEGD